MERTSLAKSLLTIPFYLSSLVFFCGLTKGAGCEHYLIVLDGRPKATIVTAENPSKAESMAAQELQKYIQKISGAQLTIQTDKMDCQGNCILIGQTRFTPACGVALTSADPGRNGFYMKTSGKYLAVAGSDEFGTLYAAYTLLEMLGVRWFMPGDIGEVVPRKTTIELSALDTKQKPDFVMRWVGGGEWSVRNKCNKSSDDISGGFKIYPGIYHSQKNLLPFEEYFAEHPEYFAMVGGRRSDNEEVKLCTSNPDVVREVAKNMAKRLDQNPGIDFISLSPSDGMSYCECENCRALDETDVTKDQRMSRRMLIFYNQVAAELAKTHPKARILAGAYHIYNRPPKDQTLKAQPNLDLVICHYVGYCNLHPVNDPNCPPNRNFRQLLLDWNKLIPDLYLYEYYQTPNWEQLICPLVGAISTDIPYFKQTGIKGLYTQYGNIWNNYLNYYVAAKLLWDADTDVKALLDDFYQKFFQEAAEPMKKYYTTLEEAVANSGVHMCTCEMGKHDTNARQIFTPVVCKQLTEFLTEAQMLAKDDKVKTRLEKIAVSLAYTKEFANYISLKIQALQAGDSQLRKAALARLESIYEDVNNNPNKYEGIIVRNSSWQGYLDRCRKWAATR